MEIKNYTNAIASYKVNSYDKSIREKQKSESIAKNTDKVEFSSKPTSVQGLKATIGQKVEGSASTDKINGLKNLVSNGQYNIPAETISKAILE